MVQFDKSFHPVVLYEYYFICIFMHIHENLKKERKSRKNYIILHMQHGDNRPIYLVLKFSSIG